MEGKVARAKRNDYRNGRGEQSMVQMPEVQGGGEEASTGSSNLGCGECLTPRWDGTDAGSNG